MVGATLQGKLGVAPGATLAGENERREFRNH